MLQLITKNLSAADFVSDSTNGNIDIAEFYETLNEKLAIIQKKYAPFITIIDTPKLPKKQGALYGLPISVKDCICTANIKTTAGSKILENYIPPFDATSVKKINESGGVIIGKTAQDEFGFGTFSTNCAYEIPRNPHDPNRSCGGSSGGAGCISAAADFPHIAIAESTGGSITAPAAFTGTVGITPTYGRVSRYGLIDYSNSMDKIGVIAKNVYDAALGLTQIAGYDPKDTTSSNIKSEKFEDYTNNNSIKGMHIGIPKEYFDNIDNRITKAVMDNVHKLESDGAIVNEVSLNLTQYALPSYYLIAMSEASTNLAKYSGLRYGMQNYVDGGFSEYFSDIREKGFGREAKRRIILGTYARAAGFRDAYYMKALKVRRLIIDEFKERFKHLDALIAPSMPIIAPRFDEIEKLTPLENYNMDKLTIGPNMSGIPTISLPIGRIESMPIGMQIIGDHYNESKIIRIAAIAERNLNGN